jgi:hypothetical protein
MDSASTIARFFDDVDHPKLHKLGPFGRHPEEMFERLNSGLLNSSSAVPRGGFPFSRVCQPDLQTLLMCSRKMLSAMQSMRFSVESPLEREVLLAVMPRGDEEMTNEVSTFQHTRL